MIMVSNSKNNSNNLKELKLEVIGWCDFNWGGDVSTHENLL
jgi:hypothetical protein